MVPMLRNQGKPSASWRDAIYYAYYENAAVHNVPVHDGVRTDRYKLMFFPRTREWNLFDLETDPQEMNSVHDDPEYADDLGRNAKTLSRLATVLRRQHRRDSGDSRRRSSVGATATQR